MAERFGTSPSRLLDFPPDEAWLGYCLDEAIHFLVTGHEARDRRWEHRFRKRESDGSNLYDEYLNDPRTGKPPSRDDLLALEYAGRHSGVSNGA